MTAEHRRAFEHAPVPVGVFTAGSGVVYCNPAAVEFLGADRREDVLGRPPESFVRPDDRGTVKERVRKVVEGREPTEPLTQRFVGLDGEERVADVATAPVTYDGEPAAQVVLNDVTGYERTQERLREERRFVQSVIDDVLYVVDEDGDMHLWNETVVERLGYSHEEVGAIDPGVFLPPETLSEVPGLEVAAALGVASSTFHGHLRRAEDAVFSSLFE